MINENIFLLAVGLLNLTNTFTNIIYISMSKRIQINKDIMSELSEQSKAKDEILKTTKQEKKELKRQYDALLARYKKLEGRLAEINGDPHRFIYGQVSEVN